MVKIVTDLKFIKIERSIITSDKGCLSFDQRYVVVEPFTTSIVSSNQWIFARVAKQKGTIFFSRKNREPESVITGDFFDLVLSPFSLVEIHTADAEFTARGFLLTDLEMPENLPAIICATDQPFPMNKVDLKSLMARATDTRFVHIVPNSTVVEKARQYIDSNYMKAPSLFDVADELDIAPSSLSRAFRRELGLPPLRYRHKLQIMDAVSQLSGGKPIANVAMEVGFADLSRFYKIFKSLMHLAPGHYL